MSGAAEEAKARRLDSLRSAVAPVLPFLNDESVVEVMLNADGKVWLERAGKGMHQTDVKLAPDAALRMLRLIAAEAGTVLTENQPSMAVKLPHWGARVQAAIPPVTEAPVFAFRKPAKVVFSLDDYVAAGILSRGQRDSLEALVLNRTNVLVGGGTGSGKTTFANALLKVIAEKTRDRVHLVEDTPELQCEAPNKVQVLVHPPVYTWQRAIMDAMRFRPDRIVVGEVRDGAALEMLKAWNTGHPGGVATVHANDTLGMLERVCQLVEEVVHPAPRAFIAQAIGACVHLQRDPASHAGRVVTGIVKVLGYGPQGWVTEPVG